MLAWKVVSRFCNAVNYYKLFNIPINFTEEQLKSSYLELVKQYHPDLSKHPNAGDMFRAIQEGYATLSDATARLKYQSNQTGASADPDQCEIL
jgi:DnaJ-class molecular chaperone